MTTVVARVERARGVEMHGSRDQEADPNRLSFCEMELASSALALITPSEHALK